MDRRSFKRNESRILQYDCFDSCGIRCVAALKSAPKLRLFSKAAIWGIMAGMAGILAVIALVLAMMALFAFGFWLRARTGGPREGDVRAGKAGDPGVCPVCATALERGERIRSAVFPGGNGRVCHIFGCPHCLAAGSPAAERRKCPVCGKRLNPSEYLIARVFDRGERRRHVHILGCVHCRMGASAR